jgi:hypothetical protein
MRFDDGYQTLLTFALNGAVEFWEKTVTPPGFDGGGPVSTTTMRNTLLRTKSPKFLYEMTQISASVAWSGGAIDDVKAMINKNQLITVTFPDGSTLAFYGWLDKFNPGEHTEGEQPEAEVIIECSNQDENGVETEAVYTPAP